MPTAALHSHYWAVPPGPVIPPGTGASANGGYVVWQTTTLCSGFGVSQVAWEWLLHWSQTKWPSPKP